MIRFGKIVIDTERLMITVGPYVADFSCQRPKGGGRPADVRFAVLKYLLCADGRGLCREQLFGAVYGAREDGGPLSGLHQLDVLFQQMKATMDRLELKLVSEKRAGTMYYRVVPTRHVV